MFFRHHRREHVADRGRIPFFAGPCLDSATVEAVSDTLERRDTGLLNFNDQRTDGDDEFDFGLTSTDVHQ